MEPMLCGRDIELNVPETGGSRTHADTDPGDLKLTLTPDIYSLTKSDVSLQVRSRLLQVCVHIQLRTEGTLLEEDFN